MIAAAVMRVIPAMLPCRAVSGCLPLCVMISLRCCRASGGGSGSSSGSMNRKLINRDPECRSPDVLTQLPRNSTVIGGVAMTTMYTVTTQCDKMLLACRTFVITHITQPFHELFSPDRTYSLGQVKARIS